MKLSPGEIDGSIPVQRAKCVVVCITVVTVKIVVRLVSEPFVKFSTIKQGLTVGIILKISLLLKSIT
jgi:hypothetical protein